ncbi:dihydrolipoyllysine-residue acetyltransferase [Aestuariibacter halophilus]|uniref:Dihydrolipoamide acetyltransferase component of pyruvate dehydrogenase complex n=1 Tax=Fluctibacter halophilus TaxID=226011 RepID=A0ABS8G7K9_9ALTE|nr:dihydrolipoyllysine-residue acetyltransferase [Aestuariibacter halophilus]MCC2615654.1 dihydrolipoyllysine-residue acetyltransferase [Aestuariibacter halophilus]
MTDFILPDIGEGIVECELLEWLVAEGDHIEEDQPVAEVMTDKATVQIPAMHAGVVKKLYYKAGDIAKVHEPLFAMQQDGETSQSAPEPAPSQEAAPVTEAPASSSAGQNVEDFILPDIGEGIVECEIVKWLVAEGDNVEEDQVVVEVMTDKAVVEIPAKHAGTVLTLHYQQGDIAKVHTPLFALQTQGDGASQPVQAKPAATTAAVATETSAGAAVRQGKALASPAVRRLAREHNINIADVAGSGKKGRVMKADIEAFVKGGANTTKQAASQPQSVSGSVVQTTGGKRVEPIRGIKAAMAKQMTQSVFTIPHFSVSEEIQMDALIAARAKLKPVFEAQGVKLSFMPFFIKAMSMALKAFPVINSQVNDDCTEITYFDDHNIGMAVDSKIGLLVPNIKAVQNLSLLDVAKEANRLIDLAREGRLPSEDLKGGTISISNIGVLGGTVATPVINKPESAIVALGKMQRLPRFDEHDNVQAVNIMHVSWSGDHRIIDGATMVKFNNLWKSYLEDPLTMLSELK